MTALPMQLDFASEVRTDRLRVLWRATAVVSFILGWIVLSFTALNRTNVVEGLGPFVILVLACLVTRALLNRNHYKLAAWAFSLGAVGAVSLTFFIDSPVVNVIAPFALPVVVFMIGLLLPPWHTVIAATLASVIIIVAPAMIADTADTFTTYHLAAIGLIILAAALSIQVTGDLYQIIDWALANYHKERRTANELFDNRMELERSLRRAEALSEDLQQVNSALDAARASAEEAKHYRGQFLANMSHELRTPLNAVIGFSETMLKFPAMYDGVKLPSAYEADLGQIYTSGRQLLNLINDILDLSKVDAGKLEVKMEKVDLTPVIYNVVSTASGLVGAKPIQLKIDLPQTLPLVYADRARVSQVLLNLYSNAAKFTDEGSITVSAYEVDEGIVVSVHDTGSGIPAESLELIFEEFKQADLGKRDPRSGAGLGLAISRQLLTLMGGSIWAESAPGEGSTLSFIVQRYPEETEAYGDHEVMYTQEAAYETEKAS